MSISAEFVVSLSYAWMISFKEVAIMAIHLNFDNRLDIESILKTIILYPKLLESLIDINPLFLERLFSDLIFLKRLLWS